MTSKKIKENELLKEFGISKEEFEKIKEDFHKTMRTEEVFEALCKELEEIRKNPTKDYKHKYTEEFYKMWDRGMIS